MAADQEQLHNGLAPVSQGLGPQLPELDPGQEVDYDIALEQELAEHLVALTEDITDFAITVGLISCIQRCTVTFEELRSTLDLTIATYGQQEAEITGIPVARLHPLLRQLAQEEFWQLRWSLHQDSQDTLDFCQITSDDRCKDWVIDPKPSASLGGFHRERVVLHLFSGRRRVGDLQLYMERLHAELPHCDLTVVSVDLVSNKEWGDVSLPHVRSFWLDAIRRGWVAGALAGPPCESWSTARSRELVGEAGPRPLRSREHLWGLPALRLCECQQVLLGNILLAFTIEVLVMLYLTDGIGAFEHPACREEEDAPSVWRLPLVRQLLLLPGFQLLTIHQGRFGAPSAKPTGLMLLNMPNAAQDLSAWWISQPPYPEVSIGRSQDGSFRTCKLKEYPPALCAGLSTAFTRAIEVAPLRTDGCVPPAFITRCKEMKCSYTAFIGRDYVAR